MLAFLSLPLAVEEYISVAKEKYGYNGEQALGMLFWHKHDLERAVMDLANFTPFPDEWTIEDKVLFEQAFQFHGKSFHRIRQMVSESKAAPCPCFPGLRLRYPNSCQTNPLPVWSSITTRGRRRVIAAAPWTGRRRPSRRWSRRAPRTAVRWAAMRSLIPMTR